MRPFVALLLIVPAAAVARAERAPQLASDQTLTRFFAPTTPPLVSYHALRRLSASTRGGKMSGTLVAETSLDPTTGLSYQIVSEEGSGLICRKVLLAALNAEQKAIRGDDARQAALTKDNYDFLGISTGSDALLKVDIRPRRKAVMLVEGSLFLKPDDEQLVRVEGDLSARPSFWTRKVHVVREYAEITGVHVPIAMRSVADVLIVGASNFVMTYDYEDINGHKVRER